MIEELGCGDDRLIRIVLDPQGRTREVFDFTTGIIHSFSYDNDVPRCATSEIDVLETM